MYNTDYNIIDEARNSIEVLYTRSAAEKAIAKYEAEDKANGTYKPNFYSIEVLRNIEPRQDGMIKRTYYKRENGVLVTYQKYEKSNLDTCKIY